MVLNYDFQEISFTMNGKVFKLPPSSYVLTNQCQDYSYENTLVDFCEIGIASTGIFL